jgi:hypothetical protein
MLKLNTCFFFIPQYKRFHKLDRLKSGRILVEFLNPQKMRETMYFYIVRAEHRGRKEVWLDMIYTCLLDLFSFFLDGLLHRHDQTCVSSAAEFLNHAHLWQNNHYGVPTDTLNCSR